MDQKAFSPQQYSTAGHFRAGKKIHKLTPNSLLIASFKLWPICTCYTCKSDEEKIPGNIKSWGISQDQQFLSHLQLFKLLGKHKVLFKRRAKCAFIPLLPSFRTLTFHNSATARSFQARDSTTRHTFAQLFLVWPKFPSATSKAEIWTLGREENPQSLKFQDNEDYVQVMNTSIT